MKRLNNLFVNKNGRIYPEDVYKYLNDLRKLMIRAERIKKLKIIFPDSN